MTAHVIKPQPALEGSAIELPPREPYAFLLCQIKAHMLTYMFMVPEEQMDAIVEDWQRLRDEDGILTLDTGAQGTWHIPATEILFLRRITATEQEAMKRAESLARFGGGPGIR